MAAGDQFATARLRRELPRLTAKLGHAPTREDLEALGFDAALLKRLEADGILVSKLVVLDGTGAKRRTYSLKRFLT